MWPRADARYRDLTDPNDYLEMLCDAGAAELVFPRRWFVADAAPVRTAGDLIALAGRYKASREATLRRYAELHADPVAAVFFSWKLKPTQKATVGNTNQANLFGLDPKQEALAARRLRIEYAIPSQPFVASGLYLPRDKSVGNNGPLYEAAATYEPADGECDLDLGAASGRYTIHALPLWTSEEELGPCGECSVAAIIRPLKANARRLKDRSSQRGLFE